MGVLPQVAYHPFEGTANDMSEIPRLQQNIGHHKKILLLDNHGPLTLGTTIDEAFALMFNVCRASSYQQKAMAAVGGNLDRLYLPDETKLAAMYERGRNNTRMKEAEKGGGSGGGGGDGDYEEGAGANPSDELMFRALCRVVEDKYGAEKIYLPSDAIIIIRLQRPESGCVVWVLACVGVCVVRPFPGGRHSHAARRAGRDRGRGGSGARASGAGDAVNG